MGIEKIEIPTLTQEQETRLIKSLHRVKQKCLDTKQIQFVNITFIGDAIHFTESWQQVIIK